MIRFLAPMIIIAALMVFSARAQNAFVPGIEDLPLMDGLTVQGEELVFHTPDGRIVQVEAAGPHRASEVGAFYAEVLPQLGWRRTSQGVFARDDETLSLVIEEKNGDVRIQFSLTPK